VNIAINFQKVGGPLKTFIEEKMSALEAGCRAKGYSMTVQRRAILEDLASRKDHPTADQIYSVIKDKLRGVSRTTVYRVLEAFVELGIAQKICNPEAKARFDANTSRHHHAICLNCEKVVDVHESSLNEIPLPQQGMDDFKVFDYSISYIGTCKECSQKSLAGSGHITC
jgi:Fur family peroxide stress response transcriptional regulator